MKKKKLQKIETIATHAGIKPEENHGIVNPPVNETRDMRRTTIEGEEALI